MRSLTPHVQFQSSSEIVNVLVGQTDCFQFLLSHLGISTQLPSFCNNPRFRTSSRWTIEINRIVIPHARQSRPKALMARGSQNPSLVSLPDGISSADGQPWVCRHAAGAPHGAVYNVHFEPGRVRAPRRYGSARSTIDVTRDCSVIKII